MELLRLDAEKVAGTHPEAIGERPPEKDRKRFTGDGEREREKFEFERERVRENDAKAKQQRYVEQCCFCLSLVWDPCCLRYAFVHFIRFQLWRVLLSFHFIFFLPNNFFFFGEMFDFWLLTFFFLFVCGFIFGKGNLEFFLFKVNFNLWCQFKRFYHLS